MLIKAPQILNPKSILHVVPVEVQQQLAAAEDVLGSDVELQTWVLGLRALRIWVRVPGILFKGLNLSYRKKETLLFIIDPSYRTLNPKP